MSEPIFLGESTPDQDERLLASIAKVKANWPTCPRCGAKTLGTREGDTDYCTSCGGEMGTATTKEPANG